MSKPGAFVLGYTGATGKALVQELAKDSYFGRVVLIGRREVKLDVENDEKFEQKVVDFDNLDNFKEAFSGCDAGFCCLGTRLNERKETRISVDRDYVIKAGELAKSAGCKHFTLLTSTGANKNSMFLYLKTKGQAEEGVRQQGFERFSIFRPGLLLADRGDRWRIAEKLYKCLIAPAKAIHPDRYSIPVEILARAMLNNAKTAMTQPEEAYDNSDAHRLSKESENK